MELGGSMIQLSKPKYPEKQTINLAKQENNQIDPKISIGSFLIFLFLLMLFVKFAVIDRIQVANNAQHTYEQLKQQIEDLKKRTEQYEEVRKEYRQFDDAFLSEEEAGIQDRLEIMTMIETCVGKNANMTNMTITGNQVHIVIDQTNLSEISKIVARLEKEDLTAYVTVSTAKTASEENKTGYVTADVVVQLKAVQTKKGEKKHDE